MRAPRWGASQHSPDRIVLTLERFVQIEAVRGGVLIFAALLALVWANAAVADSCQALWQAWITLGIGLALVGRVAEPHARPPAVNGSDMPMLIRAVVLLCSAAFAPIAAPAGQVVPSALLIERCRGFADDHKSAAARLCDSYIRGYLAGASSAGWLIFRSDKGPQETFSERAWRTRLGRATRLPSPQSCLPDGTSMYELVAKLLAYADARTSLEGMSAPHLLEGMLRAVYPCSRKPVAGKT